MRRAVAALALLAGAAPAQDACVRALDGEHGVEVAVQIEDLDGRVVYAFRGDQPLVQASVTKLLTGAAALTVLGPDYRWRTEAQLAGRTLWLRGNGDPSLRETPAGDHAEAFLDRLAAALRERDVAALDELVLDDRAFERTLFHPLWPAAQRAFDYSAPVSALSVAGNVLELRIDAGGALRLLPEPGPGLAVERRPGAGVFQAVWTGDLALRVSGDLATPATGRLAMRAPVSVFGEWLRGGLAARGVWIERARLAGADEAAPQIEPFLRHDSAWSVADALLLAHKQSDNFVAEALLRTVAIESGQRGDAAGGAAAVRAALEQLGVDLAGLNQADGSGYARGGEPPANSAPPRLICGVLRAMAQGESQHLWFDSLVVGGEEGRLRGWFQDSRFQPRRVRAKTGFITGASSLAGYLLAGAGDVLVFSIVVNYVPDGSARTNGRRFREIQEQILRELLETWPNS